MQPSRRTFLKTAAVAASAGALWTQPAEAQDVVAVHVHFLGMFVALKEGNKSYIVSVKDKTGMHEAHSVMLAVHPANYLSGGIGELACVSDEVRAFEISKEQLYGPEAHVAVSPSYPKASGPCPATAAEWRNPRWHVKLASAGFEHSPGWFTRREVDVKMQIQPDAIEAEAPLSDSVRRLQWKVRTATQALTDRLLYVVKTRNPEFKFDGATLRLKSVASRPIDVYVLTVPRKLYPQQEYKVGDKLSHFAIGHPLLKSGSPIPEAVANCRDVPPEDLKAPLVENLYSCLFAHSKLEGFLSKTTFCPGYGSYP